LAVAAWLAASASAASWNPKAAAAYLDQRTAGWMNGGGRIDHGTFCVSCHGALPYALARGALRAGLGEREPCATERRLLDSVSKRVRMWQEVQPFLGGGAPSRGTECVENALILVTRDAPGGALSDDARQAVDTMWARQLKSGKNAGAWPWFGDGGGGEEPWEAFDSQYWGATLAGVAVGTMPQAYGSDNADNLKLLQGYLRGGQSTQSLHNRLTLLWAADKWPDLLTAEQRQAIVTAVLAKQHADGGWSVSDLVAPAWRRFDGSPQETTSDGYATGLATFVLEQSGPAGPRPGIDAARAWLMANQDAATGAWPARSWNKRRDPASDVGRFMSDAATAYAVLALTSGG
jgi:hypothetical protein